MVDDQTVEPDYFIDRCSSAVFVPDPDGVPKATELANDFFDFKMEVEPILQVLVGRTLE